MAINYEKIQQAINECGQHILKSIKSQYNSSLTQSQLQTIDELLSTDFIVIEKPKEEDKNFFSEQDGITNSDDYSFDYVPSAHGGRTKDDNKIHIYPYTKSFSNCINDDEIIQLCIDDILVHEIFHYFIRPNLSDELDTTKIEFGHFITEGLVQYYAEKYAQKNKLGSPKANYGKNVEFAKRLIDSFDSDLSQEQIDRIVFTYNQDELLNISKNGMQMYQEYAMEAKFKDEVSFFIRDICIHNGLSKNDKKLKGILRHYEKIEDIDTIMNELNKVINSSFKNNPNMKIEYAKKLRDLISRYTPKKDITSDVSLNQSHSSQEDIESKRNNNDIEKVNELTM